MLRIFLFSSLVSMTSSIAVITGANKGIGFEIAKKIAHSGQKTILTARDVVRGQNATDSLKSLGYDVEFRQLDICEGISRDYGCCDILINNAATAFKGSDPTPFQEQAEPTMTPNFFGTLELTEKMLPLLQKSSSPRIVNVASQSGLLRILPTKRRKDQFTSDTLSI
eukprot:gene13519-28673_t